MHKAHTRSLIRLIDELIGEPLSGIEIGSWKGENLVSLLQYFPKLQMIGVDAWNTGLSRKTMKVTQDEMDAAKAECLSALNPFGTRSKIVVGNSLDAAGFTDLVFDFAFIDACHKYEAVRDDITAWWPKVRVGGLLAGHDYGGMGDKQGRFGVKRAVDEFTSRIGKEVIVRRGHVWGIVK